MEEGRNWVVIFIVVMDHQNWFGPESFRTMPGMGNKTYEFQELVILRANEKNHEQKKGSVRMLLGCDGLDCICEV